MLEQFVKICDPGKDSHCRSLWSTVSHGRDAPVELGKSVRIPLPEEEGRVEKMDELTTAPIPYLPVLLETRGTENGK